MKAKRVLNAFFTLLMLLTVFSNAASAAVFSDVPDSHPYKSAIDFCQDKGYVLGTTDTTFEPDASLTRGQLATIWCRSLNILATNHSFNDITSLNNYYDTPTIVLNSLGIIHGTSATQFSPSASITREQLALITMRTYGLGVADDTAYTQYDDNASISEWARDGISACINADVFKNLYDGSSFHPSNAVTRAEICQLIYNLAQPAYFVSIDTLTGGTITADPTVAHAGDTITLTINPDSGKQLKSGTLMCNGTAIQGTTFVMPAEDVAITAEFEDVPATATISSITVTTPPTKTSYTVGETLDLTGLVVTATYSDGSSAETTAYTTSPADGTTLDTAGTVTVTATSSEDTSITTTFDVTTT